MTTDDGVLIYKARNYIEASALAAYLGNAEIDAHVSGNIVPNVFGVSNIGPSSGAEVVVSAADRARAEELIREWLEEHGEPEQPPEAPPRFGLLSLFKVMTAVALVTALGRVLGGDFMAIVYAAYVVFWAWVLYLCVRWTRKKVAHGRDHVL
jgi:hypothetical protein